MKVNFALFVFSVVVAQSALAASASKEINCSGVKIDALSGAEHARAGIPLEKGLASLADSYRDIDAKLIKMNRKPSTLVMKTQGKISFADGYNEALRQPDQTVDQIAGQAFLACTFAKYK